jgi:putative ABC transport system ATP-binding protein
MEDAGPSVRPGENTVSDAHSDLTQIPPADVVVVPASFALLPMLTVEENVVLPLRLAGLPADAGWIRTVLETVELDGRASVRPGDLTRGEQLRAALARAVATRPATLIVADLAGTVDSVTRHGAIRTLRRIADELCLTVVLATQDAAAAGLPDRIPGDAVA